MVVRRFDCGAICEVPLAARWCVPFVYVWPSAAAGADAELAEFTGFTGPAMSTLFRWVGLEEVRRWDREVSALYCCVVSSERSFEALPRDVDGRATLPGLTGLEVGGRS